MTLTFEEKDAISEIANIAVGTAACYVCNVAASDMDISVPHFFEANDENMSELVSGRFIGYKLSSASFTAGYCICVLKDNFTAFSRIMEYSDDAPEVINKRMKRVVETALEPVERLSEQTVNVDACLNLGKKWISPWKDEEDKMVSVYFDALIDGKINAKMLFVFPSKIAKRIADKFINNGVALTTV